MLKLFNVSFTIHFVSRSILIVNPFPQPHYQTSRFKPVPQQHQKPIKNSQHPSARFFCIFQKTTYTQTNLPNSKSHGAPFHWIHPHHDDFSLHLRFSPADFRNTGSRSRERVSKRVIARNSRVPRPINRQLNIFVPFFAIYNSALTRPPAAR